MPSGVIVDLVAPGVFSKVLNSCSLYLRHTNQIFFFFFPLSEYVGKIPDLMVIYVVSAVIVEIRARLPQDCWELGCRAGNV